MTHPIDLFFEKEAQDKLISGIKKLSKAVKSTLGPRGNTVLIESISHPRGMTVTKDGATVAKAVELLDPVENLACRMMKDASKNTADIAKDGSSTAIILAEALVIHGIEEINRNPDVNRAEMLRKLNEVCEEYVEELKKMAIPLDDNLLKSVAIVSSNNDEEVGNLISDVYAKVGRGGIVHFENSPNFNTYTEVYDGMKIDRGYYEKEFSTDKENETFVAENCLVLVCNQDISNFVNQLNIELIAELSKHNVLFIAPFSKHAVQTLVANVNKMGWKWCAVQPPSIHWRQEEFMQDIALKTGATFFSEKAGDDLGLIAFKDFGKAKKVVVSRDKTIIIPNDDQEIKDKAAERIKQLEKLLSSSSKTAEMKHITERIGLLGSGVGIIYVGGNDMEQKEMYYRVEDAVGAVKSAIEEGILPGAGKALAYIAMIFGSRYIECLDNEDKEKALAYIIMRNAANVPIRQILANAGLDYDDIYEKSSKINTANDGYNVKTGEYGDLIQMGVVDPLKVTRVALQNAVSVAITILSTNAVLTIARE
jgi:chaperonin GroEL